MSGLWVRLARLEHAAPRASFCRCPFDYESALAALAGASAEAQRCRRCGLPPALVVELVDDTAEGWR